MADYNGCLYVGTSDESTIFRDNPAYAAFVAPELGADLWSSCDGVNFSAIDINGFEDEFNYGYRTFLSHCLMVCSWESSIRISACRCGRGFQMPRR